jgi:hypothetical protein
MGITIMPHDLDDMDRLALDAAGLAALRVIAIDARARQRAGTLPPQWLAHLAAIEAATAGIRIH